MVVGTVASSPPTKTHLVIPYNVQLSFPWSIFKLNFFLCDLKFLENLIIPIIFYNFISFQFSSFYIFLKDNLVFFFEVYIKKLYILLEDFNFVHVVLKYQLPVLVMNQFLFCFLVLDSSCLKERLLQWIKSKKKNMVNTFFQLKKKLKRHLKLK